MRPQYLVAVGTAPSQAPCDTVVRREHDRLRTFESPAGIDVAAADCPVIDLAGQGLIVGHIYDRHGPRRVVKSLPPGEIASILATSGRHLLSFYWGDYIILWREGGRTKVARDASGMLPCYHWAEGNKRIFASDIDLLRDGGMPPPKINWSGLAHYLYSAGLPIEDTALDNVSELLPGCGMTIEGAEHSRFCFWSPWDHVADRQPEAALDMRAERLERIVRECVAAMAGRYKRPLISLSGGLDSSIIAACIAGKSGAAHAINMFGDDPHGDERDYARDVARRLEIPLRECRFEVGAIDILRPMGTYLPRPLGRTQAMAYEDAHVDHARRVGADCFVTGNGGDNVFAHSQSATAAVDRFLAEGAGAGTLSTLLDISRQTDTSLARTGIAAFRRWRRNSPAYRWPCDTALLDRDLVADMSRHPFSHPWLEPPPGTLPGKAVHVAQLLRTHYTLEPGRSRHAPVLHPLLAQPIIETCLAIPTWLWRSGGRDRAVARAAFARALPESVIERRQKGGPGGFSVAVIAANRDKIRARLLDGHLARERIIDRDALCAALSPRSQMLGDVKMRVQELLVAENWVDHWLGA